MKYRSIKYKLLAVVAATSLVLSSIPVYAEEQEDSVEENSDNGDSCDSGDGGDSGDSCDSGDSGDSCDSGDSGNNDDESSKSDSNGDDNSEGEHDGYESEVVELTVTIEEVSPESPESTENMESSKDIPEPVANETTEDVQNGEKPNIPLKNINDSYDEETEEFTSQVNYTKVLSDFSVSPSSTGRYNAKFVITETEESTGTVKQYNYVVSGFKTQALAREYAEKIQQLGKYNSGETKYAVVDNNLIDAEKRPLSEDDTENNRYADLNLCWAGSISDMLELSGWNKVSGYNYNGKDVSNEDKLLDLFSEYYSNNAGNQGYGLGWFFNGVYIKQGKEGWAQLKDSTEADGIDRDGYSSPMLKEYCSSDLVKPVYYISEDGFGESLKSLDADADGDRCTIGLIIGYYRCDDDGRPVLDADGKHKRDGGHCITIVGYSTDENGIPNAITIADSDTYNSGRQPETAESDRSNYKNMYSTYPVEYYDDNWHLMNYYSGNNYDTIIDELDILKYYSENTKNKLELNGTLDIQNDYDFDLFNNYLRYITAQGVKQDYELTVYQGDELFGTFQFRNRSPHKDNFDETPLTYRFVISKDGEVVRTLDYSENMEGLQASEYTFYNILMDSNNPLEEGEYTVSYILNYDNSIQEAYYNNNTSKFLNKFIVIKRVDANGNIDYVVIPDTSDDRDDKNENVYQNIVTEFISNVSDYSTIVDQTAYEKDENKVFEFVFSNDAVISNVTEDELLNAEICFDYSVSGDMELADGSFGGKITSSIALTKNDYSIIRNADGTISMIFTNEFMRKLPKGTHYFKLMIAGQVRIFKIEIT